MVKTNTLRRSALVAQANAAHATARVACDAADRQADADAIVNARALAVRALLADLRAGRAHFVQRSHPSPFQQDELR